MALIPPEFIEEIQRRLNIVDFISQYVTLKKQGRNFVGLCPFHSENTPSFIVSPEKQIFHCFGCHKGGNAINFLMSIENLTFPEAVEKIAQQLGMELPKQELSPKEQERIKQRQVYFRLQAAAQKFFEQTLWSKEGVVARGYLEKRGLTQEIVRKFGLGYATDQWEALLRHLTAQGYSQKQMAEAGLISLKEQGQTVKGFDRFRERVMFPILDFKGQVVAFGGRILSAEKSSAKYLNSPETVYFHKSEHLYGLYLAGNAIRKQEEAILMEGYLDVIAAHQFGIENAVASLGTALTQEHGILLRRYTNRVLLAYDGDAAGVKAAHKGMDILKDQGFEVRVVHFPDDLDPDDFIRKHGKIGWDEFVQEHALDYWDYKLQAELKKHDIQTISGKGSLVNALLPYIARCKNQVERDSFIALLAKTVGVSPEAIYRDLQKQNSMQSPTSSLQLQKRKEQQKTQQKLDKKQANLVLFLLYSPQVYAEVEKKLGFQFTNHPLLQELLTLVQKIKTEYHWQPAALFSYLEKGETKQLLLKMLEVEIDPTSHHFLQLAEGCINGILIERLQQEIEEKECTLKQTVDMKQKKQLLAEILQLQQQVRTLRAET